MSEVGEPWPPGGTGPDSIATWGKNNVRRNKVKDWRALVAADQDAYLLKSLGIPSSGTPPVEKSAADIVKEMFHLIYSMKAKYKPILTQLRAHPKECPLFWLDIQILKRDMEQFKKADIGQVVLNDCWILGVQVIEDKDTPANHVRLVFSDKRTELKYWGPPTMRFTP